MTKYIDIIEDITIQDVINSIKDNYNVFYIPNKSVLPILEIFKDIKEINECLLKLIKVNVFGTDYGVSRNKVFLDNHVFMMLQKDGYDDYKQRYTIIMNDGMPKSIATDLATKLYENAIEFKINKK